MFKRSFRSPDARRVDKAARLRKAGAARDGGKPTRLQRSLSLPGRSGPAPSSIVMLRFRQSPLLDAALQELALRKQGLAAGIDVGTIVRSAAYAYAHTPDSDCAMRAHYLALVIRCRRTFARSGTMQAAMEAGGSMLFFDLFVALCNHVDDVLDADGMRGLGV